VLTATSEELAIYSLDKVAAIVGAVFESELGFMAVALREDALCGIVFGHATTERATAALTRLLGVDTKSRGDQIIREQEHGSRLLHQLVDEMQRYAAGEPVDFRNVPINQEHLTPFGRRIITACRRIPFGQTRSYGQLAAVCGSPGAARAVGQVMAKNRFPVVVPCHRVLAAGGRLGGFSAPDGLRMKRRLLALESLDATAKYNKRHKPRSVQLNIVDSSRK
jgi:methylated-DNA-[protein]-cysteine S-methyltransferase